MTRSDVDIRPTNTLPSKIISSGLTHHPAVMAEAKKRASSVQFRIADSITAFAGSMRFVYLHILVFAAWMLWFEKNPWPTLTLIVSLEAIFLSAFVMIGQNRQAAFQQAKADRDFASTEHELHTNTQMTQRIEALTQQIERLTTEIHGEVVKPGTPKLKG
jgi:uncharacterized membrane protein